jgi:hypothetical protein
MTNEESTVLKERLGLIFKVNIAIILLSIVWFFSVFFTIRSFGSKLWILLAVLPSTILFGGTLFLYYAGKKIRLDYREKIMSIKKGVLTKLYFKKKGLRVRYFIDIEGEKSFEIDESAFNQLNGHVNSLFAVYFADASGLVFRIERLG